MREVADGEAWVSVLRAMFLGGVHCAAAAGSAAQVFREGFKNKDRPQAGLGFCRSRGNTLHPMSSCHPQPWVSAVEGGPQQRSAALGLPPPACPLTGLQRPPLHSPHSRRPSSRAAVHRRSRQCRSMNSSSRRQSAGSSITHWSPCTRPNCSTQSGDGRSTERLLCYMETQVLAV